MEFRELSIPRNNRNSVGNNHLFRLFRLPRNYFFVGNSQPYLWHRNGWKSASLPVAEQWLTDFFSTCGGGTAGSQLLYLWQSSGWQASS